MHSEEKRGKIIPKAHCWRITEESSIKSPKLPLDVTSMATNYLESMPEKSLSCNFTTDLSTWSSLKATGTLNGTVFCRAVGLFCIGAPNLGFYALLNSEGNYLKRIRLGLPKIKGIYNYTLCVYCED